MTERSSVHERLSVQNDELLSDGTDAYGRRPPQPQLEPEPEPEGAADGVDGLVPRATPLQGWRGQSLASGHPDRPPPSPRLEGSLSGRDIGLRLDVEPFWSGSGGFGGCASSKLLQHTRIQLWKNYISAKRHPALTVLQMLSFAMFVVFLYLLQSMGKSRLMAEELHPPILQLGGVPKCKPFNGAPCTTLIYTPAGHPEVDFIMNEVAREQGLVMGEDIVGLSTAGDGNWTQYWLDHANQTLAAVNFLDRSANVNWDTLCAGQQVSDTSDVYPTGACALPDIIRYKVYYNDTTRYSRASRTYTPFYPLDVTREVQRSLDEAIITLRGRHAGYQNCEETVVNIGTYSGEYVYITKATICT